MKKILGMLVLVAAAMVMMTGCATTIQFGSENASSLSGDVPKVGQVVRVIDVIGRETQGPYEYLMVWMSADGSGKVKVMQMTGHCLVNPKSEGLKGDYLIQKDVETVIKFVRLER
jgi:hypothetical protein